MLSSWEVSFDRCVVFNSEVGRRSIGGPSEVEGDEEMGKGSDKVVVVTVFGGGP